MSHLSWPRFLALRLAGLLATLVIVPTTFFAITTALDPGIPGIPSPPVLRQVGDYVVQTFWHLDFGNSGPPAYESELARLLDGLPTDLSVAVGGMAIGLLLGLVGGSICARRPRSLRARALMVASAVALSTPPYLFGFAVLLFFAPHTGYLLQIPLVSEIADYRLDSAPPHVWIKELWVPCVAVGLPIAAQVLRMTEAGLRESLHEEFVRTARAKGLGERRVVSRHALPTSIVPVLTLAGANTVVLLTNVALMESAFNLPGAFRDLHSAVSNNDLVFLQALVRESAIFIVVAGFLVDVAQALLDPRVRV